MAGHGRARDRTKQGTYSLGEIETSAKRGTCVHALLLVMVDDYNLQRWNDMEPMHRRGSIWH